MLHRVTLAALITFSPFADNLIGQIPRGGRIGTTRVKTAAPKVLVANPTANTADSAAAVAIGRAMRERIDRGVGDGFAVIPREQMNEALLQYGYPADAILQVSAARRLAVQMSAVNTVSSTLAKLPAGQYALTARISGTNDLYAGYAVNVAQLPGQSLADFGQRAADSLLPAVKAMTDAKSCIDLQATDKAKAAEAANKAVKSVPNHGLAHLCLALLALEKADTNTHLRHLESSIKGDPQSLVVASAIAVVAQVRGDTARVVEMYQNMLAVAPTNQELREKAYVLFNRYGRPEAAMQVVDKGLELDPLNPDLYDLRSNICLGKEDYNCAIQSLEQVFALDSAKADTTFYIKILGSTQMKPDTAKYLEWARRGALKYPENTGILTDLARAYGYIGQTDSTVAVTRRLVALNPTDTEPVVRVVKSLTDAGQARRAVEFAATIKTNGDEDAKNNYAGLLLEAAQKFIPDSTRDLPQVVELGEAALAAGPTDVARIDLANYFIGLGAFFQAIPLAQPMRTQKSCELARQEVALLTKAEPALTLASQSASTVIAPNSKTWLGQLQQEKPEAMKLQQQFCR